MSRTCCSTGWLNPNREGERSIASSTRGEIRRDYARPWPIYLMACHGERESHERGAGNNYYPWPCCTTEAISRMPIVIMGARCIHLPFSFRLAYGERPPAGDRLMTLYCRCGATRRSIQNSIAFFFQRPIACTLLAPYGRSRNFEHARNCSWQATMTAAATLQGIPVSDALVSRRVVRASNSITGEMKPRSRITFRIKRRCRPELDFNKNFDGVIEGTLFSRAIIRVHKRWWPNGDQQTE